MMEQATVGDTLADAIVAVGTKAVTAIGDAVTMCVLMYVIHVASGLFGVESTGAWYDMLRLAYYFQLLARMPQSAELCRLVASWFTYDGPAWDVSTSASKCISMLAVYLVTFLVVANIYWSLVWYVFNWSVFAINSVAVWSVWRRLRAGQNVTAAMLVGLFDIYVQISVVLVVLFNLYGKGYAFSSLILLTAGVTWLIMPQGWKTKIRSHVFWMLIRALEFVLYPPLIIGRFIDAIFKRSRRWVRYKWRSFVMQPSTSRNSMLYEYQNLSGEGEIRLVKLKRMKNRTLNCELVSFPLKATPPYDAISYTWGDPARNHGVYVGQKWLPLTASAHGILQDRADNAEKSSQVQTMKEIFSMAARVVVWLGEAPEADMAVNFVQFSYSNITWGRIAPVGLTTDSIWMPDVRLSTFVTLLNHPYWFRAWVVQEIAVAQLVHISYGGLLFYWNDLEVVSRAIGDPKQWSMIPYVSLNKTWPGPTGFAQITTMSDIRRLTLMGFVHSLFSISAETWRFRATDPRDKIFSLAGISNGKKHPDLNQDYEKPVAEVYHDATCFFLENESPVNILYVAGFGYRNRISGLPSWVPDWSHPQLVSTLGHRTKFGGTSLYSASGASTPAMKLDRERRLLLKDGFQLDTISILGAPMVDLPPVSQADLQLYATQSMLQDSDAWQLTINLPDIYVNGQPKIEAFWRTLLGDAIFSAEDDIQMGFSTLVSPNSDVKAWRRPAPEIYGDFYIARVKLAAIFRQFLNAQRDLQLGLEPEEEISKQQSPTEQQDLKQLKRLADQFLAVNSDEHEAGRREFSFAMGGCASGRRFAVTSQGYMAMVPHGSQIGDSICIFHGAVVPFVLRRSPESVPQGGESGLHARLVGECYVHGVMDGEALSSTEQSDIFILH